MTILNGITPSKRNLIQEFFSASTSQSNNVKTHSGPQIVDIEDTYQKLSNYFEKTNTSSTEEDIAVQPNTQLWEIKQKIESWKQRKPQPLYRASLVC